MSAYDFQSIFNLQAALIQDLCGNSINLSNDVNALQRSLNSAQTAIRSGNPLLNGYLTDQAEVIDLVNTEYSRLQQKKSSIDAAMDGQIRAALLNESYRKRYVEYTRILIVFVITFVIVFSMIQMQNSLLEYIPSFVFDLSIFVICTLALVYCYFIYSGIIQRDKMYFDELDFSNQKVLTSSEIDQQNKLNQQQGLLFNNNANNFDLSGNMLCVGPACCSNNQTYDPVSSKCIAPVTTSS